MNNEIKSSLIGITYFIVGVLLLYFFHDVVFRIYDWSEARFFYWVCIFVLFLVFFLLKHINWFFEKGAFFILFYILFVVSFKVLNTVASFIVNKVIMNQSVVLLVLPVAYLIFTIYLLRKQFLKKEELVIAMVCLFAGVLASVVQYQFFLISHLQ